MGKKQRKRDAAAGLGSRLPTVTPNAKCKLRLLKLERIKDYLLMEHEFVQNQERLKPQDERNEEDRSKVRVLAAALCAHGGGGGGAGAAAAVCVGACRPTFVCVEPSSRVFTFSQHALTREQRSSTHTNGGARHAARSRPARAPGALKPPGVLPSTPAPPTIHSQQLK